MTIQTTLFRLIRRTPHVFIALVYRVMECVDRPRLWWLHRGGRLKHPVPPMRLRARVGSRGLATFLSAGKRCADALDAALHRATARHVTDHRSILDFACGCGRTLQCWYWTAPERFHGCDVDSQAIAWMRSRYDPRRFVVNGFEPPLPFESRRFDLLYCVSLFTHLSLPLQDRWLAEVSRVLTPDGVALLTVQGPHALRRFLNEEIYATASMLQRLHARQSLEQEGFIFEPYETLRRDRADFPGISGGYGLTFHDAAHLRKTWSAWFEVLAIEEGTVDGLQDVVVLRRK